MVALAASRNPSGENAGGVAVMEMPDASSDHVTSPAIPPMRWLPTIRYVRVRSLRRSNARINADGPRLGKINGWPLPYAITPRTVNSNPA